MLFDDVEFSLRIVNPNNISIHYEGRVEVYYSGQWGTICSYYHSNTNARVICQELGYPDARAGSASASFGTGSADQPILLSYLYCQGTETTVADCYYYFSWDNGIISCNDHSYDLSVSCVDGEHMHTHTCVYMHTHTNTHAHTHAYILT